MLFDAHLEISVRQKLEIKKEQFSSIVASSDEPFMFSWPNELFFLAASLALGARVYSNVSPLYNVLGSCGRQ
jgi:hypothetical protein